MLNTELILNPKPLAFVIQMMITYCQRKPKEIKGWNVIISKDRAQKAKRKATAAAANLFIQNLFHKHKAPAAAAIADEWNVKDRPFQALS